MSQSIRRTAVVTIMLMTAGCGGGGDRATSPQQTNVVGSSGGAVSLASGAVQMNFPSGAVSTSIAVTATPIADPVNDGHTVAGTTYEFGPTGTQFSQPVTVGLKYDPASIPEGVPASALRVAKNVNGEWHIIEEGLQVDSATKIVRAHLHSFSPYGVTVDPCQPVPPKSGLSGTISSSDCPVSSGIYADKWVIPNAGVVSFTRGASDNATLSITDSLGNLLADVQGAPIYMLTGGRTLFANVMNGSAKSTGSYSWTLGQPTSPSFQCANDTYLLPGASFNMAMQASGACTGNVKYSPVPNAIGKPLLLHYYGVYPRKAGTYTVTIGRLGTSLPLSLTIYRNGQVIGQSVPATQSDLSAPSRSVLFTANGVDLYIIEVSSGSFASDGTWTNPQGTYSLTMSK